MACLQIYQELLSLATFLRVHSNSKEVSYLSNKMYSVNMIDLRVQAAIEEFVCLGILWKET